MSPNSSDVQTQYHFDADGLLTVNRVQDCEDIIENNKLLQTVEQKSDWGRQIASIPCIVLERWIREDGVNYLALPGDEFGRLVKRKLRDPDWAWLRTTDKRF
jgi:hypothetical protein